MGYDPDRYCNARLLRECCRPTATPAPISSVLQRHCISQPCHSTTIGEVKAGADPSKCFCYNEFPQPSAYWMDDLQSASVPCHDQITKGHGTDALPTDENIFSHRGVYHQRVSPGGGMPGWDEVQGSPQQTTCTLESPAMSYHTPGAFTDTVSTGQSIAPTGMIYRPENYYRPYCETAPKISAGTWVDQYTGDIFEYFERDLPPPTIDRGIYDVDQFRHLQPKFAQLQGYNHRENERLRNDVTQPLPPPDAGPNVFPGMYNAAVGNEVRHRIERDLWFNRDGIPPTEPQFGKEQPFGFIGFQNFFRPELYVIPTQKELGELEVNGPIEAEETGRPVENLNLKAQEIRQKVMNVDACWNPDNHFRSAHNPSESRIVGDITQIHQTQRGQDANNTQHSIEFAQPLGRSIADPTIRKTLKEVMEENDVFPLTHADLPEEQRAGFNIHADSVKATLKTIMEENARAPALVDIGIQAGSAIPVYSGSVRNTLKTVMEESVIPKSGIDIDAKGGIATLHPAEWKQTLKSIMEVIRPPPASLNFPEQQGYEFAIPTSLKPTMKDRIDIPVANILLPVEQTSQFSVRPVTGQDVRQTLKEEMEKIIKPIATVQLTSDQMGGFVVPQLQPKNTLKEIMEQQSQPVAGISLEQFAFPSKSSSQREPPKKGFYEFEDLRGRTDREDLGTIAPQESGDVYKKRYKKEGFHENIPDFGNRRSRINANESDATTGYSTPAMNTRTIKAERNLETVNPFVYHTIGTAEVSNDQYVVPKNDYLRKCGTVNRRFDTCNRASAEEVYV